MNLKKKASLVSKIAVWPAILLISLQLFLGMLVGYLTAKLIAGKETGKQGRLKSVVFPVKGYKLHLHHWLLAFLLLLLAFLTGYSFFYPSLFYGVLAGVVFQGVSGYSDWHKIIKKEVKVAVSSEKLKKQWKFLKQLKKGKA